MPNTCCFITLSSSNYFAVVFNLDAVLCEENGTVCITNFADGDRIVASSWHVLLVAMVDPLGMPSVLLLS